VLVVVGPDVVVLDVVPFPPPLVVEVVLGPEVELLEPPPVPPDVVTPASGEFCELKTSPPHPSKRVSASTSRQVLDLISFFLDVRSVKLENEAPDGSPVQGA
jgi:hypothetical protein